MRSFVSKLFIASLCVSVFMAFLANVSKGQSLAFSQVLTYSGTTTSTVTLGTVPSGKVWKIENASGYGNSNGLPMGFNGQPAVAMLNGYHSNSSAPHGPIWLKDGDSVQIISSSSTIYYFLSIIEFTVVP